MLGLKSHLLIFFSNPSSAWGLYMQESLLEVPLRTIWGTRDQIWLYARQAPYAMYCFSGPASS